MKLYHFNPNTYAETYTVMAESREAAIEAVRAHIRAQGAEMMETYRAIAAEANWPVGDERHAYTPEKKRDDWEREPLAVLQRFIDGAGDRWSDKPYTIEVYEAGQVVDGEIS